MSILKKIDMYLADSNKQVDASIAATYTNSELLAKFRRIPTDDVLYKEILIRGLQDDPIVSTLAGDKLITIERGEGDVRAPAPDEFRLTKDTGGGEEDVTEAKGAKIALECMECGKKFNRSGSPRKEIRCPNCKGVDIEPA